MAKTKTTFGQRFKAARERVKLTQTEFAEQLGFSSHAAVTNFEADAAMPVAETLIKMAGLFGIDIHELLTGEPTSAVAVEVESLRNVKHGFRLILNELKPRIKALQSLDRAVKSCEDEIHNALKKIKKP